MTTYLATDTAPRRVAGVGSVVVAAHIGLLALALHLSDTPLVRPIESHVLTASLISDTPAPVAKPAAVESAKPPRPVPPKQQPKQRPVAMLRTTSAHSPFHEASAPAHVAKVDPAPVTAPTEKTAPAAMATAPAIGRETLAISAPKNVSHLDCNIARPDYPYLSKRRNEQGTAMVHFVVGLTGAIEEERIQKSSGYPGLDAAALAAIRASRCSPYREDGKPVRAAYTQPFTFNLNN